MKILGTITVETIIVDTFILLIVCSIIVLLHVKKKMRTLRNSLAVSDQTQRRMNIVVTVIISIIIICIVSLV